MATRLAASLWVMGLLVACGGSSPSPAQPAKKAAPAKKTVAADQSMNRSRIEPFPSDSKSRDGDEKRDAPLSPPPPPPPPPPPGADEHRGVEGGVEGAVEGGVVGGVLGGQPSSGSGGPKIVPAKVFADLRTSGATVIKPPRDALKKMRRDNKERVVAVVKMCVRRSGKVRSVKLIKTSGYRRYDARIRYLVRKWKHRPLKVDGKAIEACTSLTFLFRLQSAQPRP